MKLISGVILLAWINGVAAELDWRNSSLPIGSEVPIKRVENAAVWVKESTEDYFSGDMHDCDPNFVFVDLNHDLQKTDTP